MPLEQLRVCPDRSLKIFFFLRSEVLSHADFGTFQVSKSDTPRLGLSATDPLLPQDRRLQGEQEDKRRMRTLLDKGTGVSLCPNANPVPM